MGLIKWIDDRLKRKARPQLALEREATARGVSANDGLPLCDRGMSDFPPFSNVTIAGIWTDPNWRPPVDEATARQRSPAGEAER